jgi:hypothetical protein
MVRARPPAALRRKWAVVASLVAALTLLMSSIVAAGNGLGASIQIGFNNMSLQHQTTWQSSTAAVGKNVLQLFNNATSGASRALYALSKSPTAASLLAYNLGGGPAAQLWVKPDSGSANSATIAPIWTNGRGRVVNLNADLLDGVDGSAYARSTWVIRDVTAGAANGSVTSTASNCNAGEVAVGGGVTWSATPTASQHVAFSTPIGAAGDSPIGWSAGVYNNSGSERPFTVRAICTPD